MRHWLFAFSLTTAVLAVGQTPNLPRFDQKPLHFGFFLGISQLDFAVQHAPTWPEGIYHVVPQASPGYLVGIVTDLRLSPYLNLRVNPTYIAGERTLLIDGVDRASGLRDWTTRRVESSLVRLPVELKWKSERIGNHRWFVLGALHTTYDLGSKAKVVDDRLFKLQPIDYGFDLAVGTDLYFEFFKLSPQLRWSFGLGNLGVPDGTKLSQSLPVVRHRSRDYVFTFE
ncbi:MAG: hypothetical protein RL753_688 [Bacteroidota bacterium]